MENKKTKIIILIMIIILLVIVAAVLTIELYHIRNNKENVPASNENNVVENQINNNITNEAVQNNIIENNINQTQENEVVQNTVVESVTSTENNQQVSKEEIDNESIKKEEDNKQKAINIVKENWGEDEKVYFSFDSIDNNGKYIVSVRDRASTEALYWYTVDIEKETFSIE